MPAILAKSTNSGRKIEYIDTREEGLSNSPVHDFSISNADGKA